VSDNLARDIHDAVADSESVVEASVRPPTTTSRELEAMRRDVLGKLRLDPEMRVAEIGCGIALLGLPVAEHVARYVGLDFAPRAVEVANERLRAAGLAERSEVLCVDVLSVAVEELEALGRFDRVLMYGTIHYARSEEEAARFLLRVLDLLEVGGRALIGNVPLEDLQVDWRAVDPPATGLAARLIALLKWVSTPGTAPVALTRRWKARRVVETTLKRGSPAESFAPVRLPPNFGVALTTGSVERWLSTLDATFEYHWELPAPGVPLVVGRADLIIRRR
jgi:predicted O-methyltransferase YrrM